MQVIVSIAGSDSGGGAGIQADLKTISACGGYGACVVTAITAQNTRAVTAAEEMSLALIEAQMDAVFSDFRVAAVKSGMLSSARVIEAVARGLRRYTPDHYVLDPVMISKSGHRLLEPEALESLRAQLFPLASLVTPNRHEAHALTGVDVRRPEDAEQAGRRLLESGCKAVLVKGGHLDEGGATDVLVTPNETRAYEAPYIETRHTHGTGCTYSAAIATLLGRGWPRPDAIGLAKEYVTEAIRNGLGLGQGQGPTDHFHYLRGPEAAGWLERLGWGKSHRPERTTTRVGRLHVITDETLQTRFSHRDLACRAAAGGADTVQYREKRDRRTRDLVRTASLLRAELPKHVRLVVNDRADVARAAGADGVHLGHEDLPPRDARRILGPGALLGGTANSLEEARLFWDEPLDYLGVGPVFGTRSKQDPAPALGTETLAAIVRESPVPVIAIGGVTPERVREVLDTGAHGIAVLSGIACASDPQEATQRYAIEVAR